MRPGLLTISLAQDPQHVDLDGRRSDLIDLNGKPQHRGAVDAVQTLPN